MLNTMRSLSKSFVSKALMLLLVISFAMWGVGDILRSRGSSTLVTVGDEVITPGQFMGEQRNLQRSLEAIGMRGIDPKALRDEVLRRMVQERLIKQWMRDTGLRVDYAILKQHVAEDFQFRNLGGKFEPASFERYLQSRNLSEAVYLQQLSDEIGKKVMMASIEGSDMQPPKSLLKMAKAAGLVARDTVVLTVAAQPVSPASVSADEVQDYYEQHKNQYQLPETRTVEYVTFDHAALAKLGNDDAVQEMGMQIEDALAAGDPMSKAVADTGVAAQSKTLDVGKDQYTLNKDALLRSVGEQAYALGEGETSELLSTPDGRYFMVTVKAVHASAPRELKLVEADVRRAVAKEKARAETHAQVLALKQAIAKDKDWKKAAAEVKASSRVVSLPRPVIGPDGTTQASQGIPGALQEAIFERAIGDVAGPATLDNGSQMLAVVTGTHMLKPGNDTGKAAMEMAYKTEISNAVNTAVLTSLSQRYDVHVNEALLAQVSGNE